MFIDYHKLKDNHYILTKANNTYRIICLCFTTMIISMLVFRYILKSKFQYIKYVLGVRLSYPKGKIKYRWMTIEIIINLIQNYPYCSYHINVIDLDKKNTYSIDLLISLLSMIRIYIFIRLFRVAVDQRMRRIWKTYKNKNLYLFIYKSMISRNPIFFYLILNIIIIIIFMLLFKPSQDIFGDSISFLDSLWLVGHTLLGTGTGYGTLVPRTIPSQFLSIFIVIIGKLFLASLELALIYSISFNKENEKKAYRQIKMIGAKEDRSNVYNKYFKNYILYKMKKIVNNIRGRVFHRRKDYNTYYNILKLRNKVQVIREQSFLRIISSLRTETTVSDFITYVKTKMDCEVTSLINKYQLLFSQMYKYNTFFTETIFSFNTSITDIFFLSNKINNILLFIFWTGSIFPVEDHNNINQYRIPEKKQFEVKLREFFLLFQDKYNKRRKSKKINNKSKKTLCKEIDSLSILNEIDHSHLFPAYIPLKKSSSRLPSSDYDFYDDSDDDSSEEEENVERTLDKGDSYYQSDIEVYS